jgi:thiopeptide-type bacteriocin biosynthesis protein
VTAPVSAHLFHQGDLDDLILTVTGAVTRSGLVRDLFFLRYWEGGDHVRLRMWPHRAADGPRVRALVVERCIDYFGHRPSRQRLTQAGYAEQARLLAGHETRTDYTRHLQPNDTVAFVPYRPEYRRYGTGAAMAAVERHFAASSRIALGVLATRPAREARDTVAWSVLLLTWLLGGAPAGARGALPTIRPGTAAGEAVVFPDTFADAYERQRDRLGVLADRLRGFVAQPPTGTGVLAEWIRTVRELRAALDDDRAGEILDTCAHLFCNRLGVSIVDEGYLRYLAVRTVAARAEV